MANEKERYYKIFNGLADEIQHLVVVHQKAENMFLENKQEDEQAYRTLFELLRSELAIQISHLDALYRETG